MKKLSVIFLVEALILILLLILSQTKVEKISIGIIDSYINMEKAEKLNINEYVNGNDFSNHGLTISKIATSFVNVDIMYYGVLDSNLHADIEDVVKAIYWCVDRKVDIINMSFSTLEDDVELKKAIDYALSNDIIIVAACMNYSAYPSYPAAYEGVVSVSTGDYPNATIVTKNDEYLVTIDNEVIRQKSTSCATAFVSNLCIQQMKFGVKDFDKIINAVQKTIQKNERTMYTY